MVLLFALLKRKNKESSPLNNKHRWLLRILILSPPSSSRPWRGVSGAGEGVREQGKG